MFRKARGAKKDNEDNVRQGSRKMPFARDVLVFRDMSSAFELLLHRRSQRRNMTDLRAQNSKTPYEPVRAICFLETIASLLLIFSIMHGITA